MHSRVIRVAAQVGAVLPLAFLMISAGPLQQAATTVQPQAGVLIVSAAPGKANRITVTSDGEALTIRDESDLVVPSGNCTVVDGNTARCPILTITILRIDSGDLGDIVASNSIFPSIVTEVKGGPGDDQLNGSAGTDILHGGAGSDLLRGRGGDDRLYGFAEGQLTDELDNDVLDGGSGNDLLEAGNGSDQLYGFDGSDRLRGGNGLDLLYGESGPDDLDGGPGSAGDLDRLSGGDGNDTANYSQRETPVYVSLDDLGNDGGDFEHDDVRSDIEIIVGGHASDHLTATIDRQGNAVFGEGGNDLIDIKDGDFLDLVNGGSGVDTCIGDVAFDLGPHDQRLSCE